MKYCAKCGKELSDAARCCSVCGGAPVDTPPVQPVYPVQSERFAAGFAGESASGIWKLFYPANILGIAGCVLVLLSTFLPFVSVKLWGYAESISLIEKADGKIFLAAAIIGVVLCFVNKPIIPIANLVYSCILALLSLYETGNTDSAVEELGVWSGAVSRGAGYYLLILGAIIYLAAGICGFFAKKKLQ